MVEAGIVCWRRYVVHVGGGTLRVLEAASYLVSRIKYMVVAIYRTDPH